MKRYNQAVVLAVTFGALVIFGFSASNASAQECYGPDAMYGEGPTENCQQRTGKVILSQERTSMLEEGMAIPGQYAEPNRINPALSKHVLAMTGDMFSEGDVFKNNRELALAALKDKALETKPAAGR